MKKTITYFIYGIIFTLVCVTTVISLLQKNFQYPLGLLIVIILLGLMLISMKKKINHHYVIEHLFSMMYHVSFLLTLIMAFISSVIMTYGFIKAFTKLGHNPYALISYIFIYLIVLSHLLFSAFIYTRKGLTELDTDLKFKLSWKSFLMMFFYISCIMLVVKSKGSIPSTPPLIVSFLGVSLIFNYIESCIEAIGKIIQKESLL